MWWEGTQALPDLPDVAPISLRTTICKGRGDQAPSTLPFITPCSLIPTPPTHTPAELQSCWPRIPEPPKHSLPNWPHCGYPSVAAVKVFLKSSLIHH